MTMSLRIIIPFQMDTIERKCTQRYLTAIKLCCHKRFKYCVSYPGKLFKVSEYQRKWRGKKSFLQKKKFFFASICILGVYSCLYRMIRSRSSAMYGTYGTEHKLIVKRRRKKSNSIICD